MSDKKELYYRKTKRSTNQAFTMDSNMLEIMMAMDGRKSVREIAREVKIAPALFKSTFLKLAKQGLIERTVADQACVEPSFIDNMRDLLTQLNGPLGEILLDEAAEEMGFEPGRIPISSLFKYIEVVAREVPSEKQGREFKKQMFKEMNKIGL